MCTVTFSPRKRGYALAMNRDEKLTRASGLPPVASVLHGRRVLAPSEPSGGTWISVNDSGVTFALINWYAIRTKVESKAVSRGKVVNAVSHCDAAMQANERLELLPLRHINPFRLIGIFSHPREIVEWRWDLNRLTSQKHAWRLRQWISSGWDEPQAQRTRGKAFQAATKQKTVGRLEWLRRVHRSHAPASGPFSTCMHREDAATVSYTEISVASSQTAMRYGNAAPCRCLRGQLQVLKFD